MKSLRERLLEFIQAHNVMVMATCGDRGPWSASLFYASDEFTLIFVSKSTAQHVGDLEDHSKTSVSIHNNPLSWTDIRGIQLVGQVQTIPKGERRVARAIYEKKFSFLTTPEAEKTGIATKLSRIEWYRLKPTWMRLVDNSLGFGHKEELSFGPDD